MNDAELRKTIEEVKAAVKAKPENKNKSDEEIDSIILEGFFDEFDEGGITKEDLEAITNAMGYEFTDEFLAALEEEKSDSGKEKSDLEDLREIDEGESKEEFKEKIEEGKTDLGFDNEEEERKEASKLWKMDLNK